MEIKQNFLNNYIIFAMFKRLEDLKMKAISCHLILPLISFIEIDIYLSCTFCILC